MLVLTRKLEQSIQIGDDVTITILSVKGNTVRLGISAPEHIRVARTELAQKTNSQSDAVPAKTSQSTNRAMATNSETPSTGEMEVIEVQSRPNAPIKLDRSSIVSAGQASSQSQPPLYSRMMMFPDNKYETHHFRIRMDETPVQDVSQT